MKKSVKILGWGALLFLFAILVSSNFPFSFTKSQTLKEVVESKTTDFGGLLGIYIKNFKTGESYKYSENKVFEAGSLYKLWLMGAVFEKIKKGDLKEDDNLEGDASDINSRFSLGLEDSEITEEHLQFTISSAIEQMITISHNYASFLLLTKVPVSEVNNFIKRYGLKSSTMDQPISTTAADLGLYFEKLYQGEIVDQEYSKKMLDILSRQKINDRIPKYLPTGTKVAHKTGDIGYFENDGGLVNSSKGDYIIIVLTSGSLPTDADEQIAQISKAVFDYFNKER